MCVSTLKSALCIFTDIPVYISMALSHTNFISVTKSTTLKEKVEYSKKVLKWQI